MTEQAEAPPQRRFLITVERKWKLWIAPVLALLYFAWTMLIVLVPLETGVENQLWVLGGVGLYLFLFLVMLLLLPTRKVRVKKQKVKRDRMAAAAAPVEALDLESEDASAEAYAAPALPATHSDAEFRSTFEELKGRKVLEASLPPKSQNPGAVYAKAYVAIDGTYVLRVEDLVASKADAVA